MYPTQNRPLLSTAPSLARMLSNISENNYHSSPVWHYILSLPFAISSSLHAFFIYLYCAVERLKMPKPCLPPNRNSPSLHSMSAVTLSCMLAQGQT